MFFILLTLTRKPLWTLVLTEIFRNFYKFNLFGFIQNVYSSITIRSICHKKLLFLKYVYGQEISMHKSSISIIPSLKAGTHCWEADVKGAKLRNLSLIFKDPHVESGACDQNVAKSTCIDFSTIGYPNNSRLHLCLSPSENFLTGDLRNYLCTIKNI